MGRPSKYTPELAAKICEQLAEGMSLAAICRQDNYPDRQTVFRWLYNDTTFRADYMRSREFWADAVFEETLAISDDGLNDTYVDADGKVKTNWDVLGRSKLRIDTRKWALARMAPRRYGDKITQEHVGPDGTSLFSEDERARRLSALRESVAKRIAQNNSVPTDASDLA